MEKITVSRRWVIPSALAIMAVLILIGEGLGQTGQPTTHTIFITALEVKGGTTTDKLAPPPVNPGGSVERI